MYGTEEESCIIIFASWQS